MFFVLQIQDEFYLGTRVFLLKLLCVLDKIPPLGFETSLDLCYVA